MSQLICCACLQPSTADIVYPILDSDPTSSNDLSLKEKLLYCFPELQDALMAGDGKTKWICSICYQALCWGYSRFEEADAMLGKDRNDDSLRVKEATQVFADDSCEILKKIDEDKLVEPELYAEKQTQNANLEDNMISAENDDMVRGDGQKSGANVAPEDCTKTDLLSDKDSEYRLEETTSLKKQTKRKTKRKTRGKPFSCDDCGKRYAKLFFFNSHQKSHSNVKNAPKETLSKQNHKQRDFLKANRIEPTMPKLKRESNMIKSRTKEDETMPVLFSDVKQTKTLKRSGYVDFISSKFQTLTLERKLKVEGILSVEPKEKSMPLLYRSIQPETNTKLLRKSVLNFEQNHRAPVDLSEQTPHEMFGNSVVPLFPTYETKAIHTDVCFVTQDALKKSMSDYITSLLRDNDSKATVPQPAFEADKKSTANRFNTKKNEPNREKLSKTDHTYSFQSKKFFKKCPECGWICNSTEMFELHIDSYHAAWWLPKKTTARIHDGILYEQDNTRSVRETDFEEDRLGNNGLSGGEEAVDIQAEQITQYVEVVDVAEQKTRYVLQIIKEPTVDAAKEAELAVEPVQEVDANQNVLQDSETQLVKGLNKEEAPFAPTENTLQIVPQSNSKTKTPPSEKCVQPLQSAIQKIIVIKRQTPMSSKMATTETEPSISNDKQIVKKPPKFVVKKVLLPHLAVVGETTKQVLHKKKHVLESTKQSLLASRLTKPCAVETAINILNNQMIEKPTKIVLLEDSEIPKQLLNTAISLASRIEEIFMEDDGDASSTASTVTNDVTQHKDSLKRPVDDRDDHNGTTKKRITDEEVIHLSGKVILPDVTIRSENDRSDCLDNFEMDLYLSEEVEESGEAGAVSKPQSSESDLKKLEKTAEEKTIKSTPDKEEEEQVEKEQQKENDFSELQLRESNKNDKMSEGEMANNTTGKPDEPETIKRKQQIKRRFTIDQSCCKEISAKLSNGGENRSAVMDEKPQNKNSQQCLKTEKTFVRRSLMEEAEINSEIESSGQGLEASENSDTLSSTIEEYKEKQIKQTECEEELNFFDADDSSTVFDTSCVEEQSDENSCDENKEIEKISARKSKVVATPSKVTNNKTPRERRLELEQQINQLSVVAQIHSVLEDVREEERVKQERHESYLEKQNRMSDKVYSTSGRPMKTEQRQTENKNLLETNKNEIGVSKPTNDIIVQTQYAGSLKRPAYDHDDYNRRIKRHITDKVPRKVTLPDETVRSETDYDRLDIFEIDVYLPEEVEENEEATAVSKPQTSESEFKKLEEIVETTITYIKEEEEAEQADQPYNRIEQQENEPTEKQPERLEEERHENYLERRCESTFSTRGWIRMEHETQNHTSGVAAEETNNNDIPDNTTQIKQQEQPIKTECATDDAFDEIFLKLEDVELVKVKIENQSQ